MKKSVFITAIGIFLMWELFLTALESSAVSRMESRTKRETEIVSVNTPGAIKGPDASIADDSVPAIEWAKTLGGSENDVAYSCIKE